MAVASQLQLTFGERVRARRQSLKWSQADLASKLKVKQSTVSDIENGHHAPTLETVEDVAKILMVKPGVLLD